MNGTVYVALGVVFLALAAPAFGQAKKAGAQNAQNSRLAGILFTIAGTGFLLAAAISFLGD